jgi:hypothetical protein
MYIISILIVENNEITLTECYNDELIARSQFLKTIEKISIGNADMTFEPIYKSSSQTYIYRKISGYVKSYNELYKIVTLHELCEYSVNNA